MCCRAKSLTTDPIKRQMLFKLADFIIHAKWYPVNQTITATEVFSNGNGSVLNTSTLNTIGKYFLLFKSNNSTNY